MIQSIERSLDILEYVAIHDKKPVGLNDIAKQVGVAPSTCANQIKTLLKRGYLEKDSISSGYIIGSSIFFLNKGLTKYKQLVSVAKKVMDDMTNDLNETCLLGVIKHNKRVILYATSPNQDLQIRITQESDIYPTASGRILMAHLSHGELIKLIKTIGIPSKEVWHEIESESDLIEELRKIKKKKVAETHSSKHVIGVAYPIFFNDEVIASLSIFLPEARYSREHKNKIFEKLKTSVEDIERLLLNSMQIEK